MFRRSLTWHRRLIAHAAKNRVFAKNPVSPLTAPQTLDKAGGFQAIALQLQLRSPENFRYRSQ
ncbi:MAG: hypothetical protein AAF773_26105 [Cyanobacteria bacterium P01_D01_bin.115]